MVLPARIATKIAYEPHSGCWLWTASRDTTGYGRIRTPQDSRVRPAHRVVYEHLVGPIPAGLTLDHLCRVRRCVNPAHVEPVTQRENLRRGAGFIGQRARQTHCMQGHPFDENNTRHIRQGNRQMRRCRVCDRDYHRRRYHALRLQEAF